MSAADFLLIDIGNTSTKLRLATRAALCGKTRRIPTAELLESSGEAALLRPLAGWTYSRAVLSSVVPDAARTVTRAIPDALTVTPAVDSGVKLRGYPGRETLGSDRLANAAGALAIHGAGPLIVVDFGTAATYNALDAGGRFLGGVIAPGVTAVRDYLPSRTAQLPAVDLRLAPRRAIGRNTREAILAGSTLGYLGMVREILDALRAELASGQGSPIRVIATGGDAAWVAARRPGIFDVVDPDLTLQGLRTIANRSQASATAPATDSER